MSDYVHLHNHTHYSLLDAACTPEQLIQAAKNDGQSAIALTDHGVMFGCFEFYKKAKKAGIKPVLGCEAYVASAGRRDRIATNKAAGTMNYYHLVLLAKNDIGYRNLMKLTTLGHTEGYYYRPRIDRELLMRHHEGLVALSACLQGVVNAPLIKGNYDEARRSAIWYKELFGDDFYIELQDHGLPEDEAVLTYAPKLAAEIGIKLIVSNDCHYIRKDQATAHNVLQLIKETPPKGETLDIHNLRYKKPAFYFKTQNEMKDLFKSFGNAIETTLEVAEKCNVELKSDLKMPVFPIPPESKAKDLDEYLSEITQKGLQERYPKLTKDIEDRANYELDVIKKMGYSGYFLIVQDFIAAARKKGVRVGPGRGSAAGSVVAYALRIIDVDPLKYDLLFERFLNPDRVSMPDIDVDFSDDKRNVVIEYVKEKYGNDSVAQIITFGTLSSRAALKDVGRVLGIQLSEINEITEKIPVVMGKVTPLADAFNLPDLRWLKETTDAKLKELMQLASNLEGMARNSSLHAAGVVIAPGDISEYVPLYKTPESDVATQFTMKDLEDAGLLKMDFLGLRTLSIIDNTLEQIKRNHDKEIDLDAIDLEDRKVYELFGNGKTLAIFQFESEPMQDALRQLKPSSLEDLIAMNALYRPGPMDNIPEFIARKQGRRSIEYLHPIMENALHKTYGIIVYQEQVMQLVRDIAGFSLAQADIMRRAMGKKDDQLMMKQKAQFVEGAISNGVEKKTAEEIFDLVLKFASYGFNKSHSCAYAYLAYQTAWLKVHYPAEFMAANMSAELDDLNKIAALIDECKTMEINVLPPDINRSFATFSAADDKTIVFGLAGVRGVGISAVEAVAAARADKPFTSLFDFVLRVDSKNVNRRAIEALINAGAFDSMRNGHRAQLFEAVETALDFGKKSSGSADANMDSLFGNSPESQVKSEPRLPDANPWSETERLQRERAVLNFYLSGHPLHNYAAHIQAFCTMQIGETNNPAVGNSIIVCGVISAIRSKLDRKEQTIAFVTLEDFSGKAECIFWSDSYKKFGHHLQQDAIIAVKGKSKLENEQLKIVAEEVWPIADVVQRKAKGYVITINKDNIRPETIRQIMAQCASREAQGSIRFWITDEARRSKTGFEVRNVPIAPTQETTEKLFALFGRKNVMFITD
ncbi:DNA polymerase III subunit alpha [Ignavibacteria bacterium]|nr:DNA polymerase III subunit alpha [Bacteroidota bacterium]MCZ2133428.1 DNA polymerase III subunit alpha [Bacteroidota bacterium]